jgi:hypothetical protein
MAERKWSKQTSLEYTANKIAHGYDACGLENYKLNSWFLTCEKKKSVSPPGRFIPQKETNCRKLKNVFGGFYKKLS